VKKRQQRSAHIFLGGAPGVGKTFTGQALAKRFGWVHFDCEKFHVDADTDTFAEFLRNPTAFVTNARRVVASWGFIPEFASTARKFVSEGFQPVWLFGNAELVAAAVQQRTLNDTSSVVPINVPPYDADVNTKPLIESWYEVDVFTSNGARKDVAALLNRKFR
jgi:hypothetical protein